MEKRSGGGVSLQFTEEMKGHVVFGQTDPGGGGATDGEPGAALMFHLTIVVDPVDRFLHDPRHRARARGYVHCDELGGRLPVTDGVFNLFVEEGDPGLRRMLYRLQFTDVVGHALTLGGYKTVRRQHLPPLDVWPDTTTLYTRIVRGHVDDVDDPDVEVVASGVLRIRALDFARQMTTFRTSGPTRRRRTGGHSRFVAFFVGQLWAVYVRRHRRAAVGPA